MASSLQFYFLLLSTGTLLFLTTSDTTFAKPSFKPLVIPIEKDASTLQYYTTGSRIAQRTPLVPISLVLHLGGQFLWVDCDRNYVSSTYRPARCGSAQCTLSGAAANGCSMHCYSPPGPGCNNNTCSLLPANPFIHLGTIGELAQDVLSINNATVKNFLFVCGTTSLLEGVPDGVSGMAGLGRTNISLPSQLASAFGLKRKFTVCLSSSSSGNGFVLIGDGPDDGTGLLTYTPLLSNPVSTAGVSRQGEASSEYFIGVKSIKVNGKPVSVNTTLLSINNSSGMGGTKISTVDPYTVLEASIFKAVTEAFISECAARNISRVAPVVPFDVCFSAPNASGVRTSVPAIDLVLQNESTYWRITGANSMVAVKDDMMCLAFVNGGEKARTSIVIGGHQLEDILVEFDLAASARVGFSYNLLELGEEIPIDCSNLQLESTSVG